MKKVFGLMQSGRITRYHRWVVVLLSLKYPPRASGWLRRLCVAGVAGRGGEGVVSF